MIGIFTTAQQNVLARLAALTREKIAPRAAHYDAIASNPIDSWCDLWGDGFLAMTILPQYGGLGLDMLTYIGAIETLAQGCANTAKYLATHVGLQVTTTAMQVVGGRSTLKDLPVERAYRDLRTCTLMPPTVDRMLEAVGKGVLGVEAAMFNFGPVAQQEQ